MVFSIAVMSGDALEFLVTVSLMASKLVVDVPEACNDTGQVYPEADMV